jgi:2-oxoglutarate dehydrogenase E2 component (dihydrolipoamide succinyltransferase)
VIEIKLPQLGETVVSGLITSWFKQVGDAVAEGEPLYEVETDKVSVEVPSPASGTLSEIRVPEGETVDVGTVMALLSSESEPSQEPPASISEPSPQALAKEAAAEPVEPPSASLSSAAPSASVSVDTARRSGPKLLSPVVRKLIKNNNLDVSGITGTGRNGRITRADVERLLSSPQPAAAQVERPEPSQGRAGPPQKLSLATAGSVPMNRIRQVTGERMVASRAISPHAITAVEVDYEAIEEVRRAHGKAWKLEHGSSLTYLPFICRALSDAIAKYPLMNASVGENEVIVHEHVNLAIAVDMDFDGLVAPVMPKVEEKRLVGIARGISDLAQRARSKKLAADELTGGTFTVSNSGTFGTFMVAPIINQPQVAILSTDGVTRKPVVVTDDKGRESIAIHSVGMLVLCWDHRAFDGAYAAAFLRQLKVELETFDWETEL